MLKGVSRKRRKEGLEGVKQKQINGLVEIWSMGVQIFEMKRIDKIRNKEICNVSKALNEFVRKNILTWHGHVRRMKEIKLGKKYMRVNVVEEECKDKMVYDRNAWRDFFHGRANDIVTLD